MRRLAGQALLLLGPDERLVGVATGRICASGTAGEASVRVLATDRRMVAVTWWASGRLDTEEFDYATSGIRAGVDAAGSVSLEVADDRRGVRLESVSAADLDAVLAAFREAGERRRGAETSEAPSPPETSGALEPARSSEPPEGPELPAGREAAPTGVVGQIIHQQLSRDSSRLADALFPGPDAVPPGAVPASAEPPVLRSVSSRRAGARATVSEVVLEWMGRTLRGRGRAGGTWVGRHVAAARATVEALRPLIDDLALEHLQVTAPSADAELVVATVATRGRHLAGAATVGVGEEDLGAPRAVLDAVAGPEAPARP